MNRQIHWFMMLLALAGIGFGIRGWWKAHQVLRIDYKTEAIKRRRVVGRVTASGTLQATVTVQVGAQVSGRIMKITVDFNSPVKKGELIAELDPLLYAAAVKQAEANYAQAKADLAKSKAQQRDAELTLERTRALEQQTLATAADLQTADTNVLVARANTEDSGANLAQAKASLNQAKVNLSYTDIYSPIDGTVISRAVDVGQTVASSLQAPVLFTIAEDLRRMQVYTNVSESDVGRLESGMPTSFTVDAFPGQRFKGKVGQVRNAAQVVQNVVTYNAVIDADNPNLKLRPGMTATVNITWAERDDVLTISNAALRFRPPTELTSVSGHPAPFVAVAPAFSGDAGTHLSRQRTAGPGRSGASIQGSGNGAKALHPTVWILQNSKPLSLRIQTGLSDGTVTEIVSGNAHEGDLAITDASFAGTSTSAPPESSGARSRMGRLF